MPKSIDKLPFWKRGTAAAVALGALAGGAVLTGCAPEKPAATATATQSGETNKDQENWADYVATVEQYPDVESAAEYLMGGSDGKGLYSEILSRAGQRGEDTSDLQGAPAEAIEALFGPEPANGYPANVVGMISQLNEYHDRFVIAYRQTVEMGTPVSCTTTLTNVERVSSNTVKGRAAMTCVNVGGLIGNKDGDWDWEAGILLTLAQQESGNDKTWVIVDAKDAE